MTTWSLLYVDDEADIRSIVEFALDDEPDFQLRLCADAAQALKAVNEARPDLVLLDVMMPGMDGPATLRRLRELPDPPPVVFVTAKIQPAEIDELLAMGAIHVIGKPFDPLSLAEQIRAVATRLATPS